jgi:hypothetical protein
VRVFRYRRNRILIMRRTHRRQQSMWRIGCRDGCGGRECFCFNKRFAGFFLDAAGLNAVKNITEPGYLLLHVHMISLEFFWRNLQVLSLWSFLLPFSCTFLHMPPWGCVKSPVHRQTSASHYYFSRPPSPRFSFCLAPDLSYT